MYRIPEGILEKPAKLEPEEIERIREHPEASAKILSRLGERYEWLAEVALQVHERADGSGYPKGLKGKELNDLARMSSIVDIFGALTDARSYKPAFPAEKAFAILEEMGPGIDQNLLKVFKDIFTPGMEAA